VARDFMNGYGTAFASARFLNVARRTVAAAIP